jgi:hypothetical protein
VRIIHPAEARLLPDFYLIALSLNDAIAARAALAI